MHARLTLMLAIVLVLLLNAGATLPLHAQEDRAAGLFTEARLLPLVSQSLAVRIGSGEATLVLTQVFANDGQAVGQADYHLELPREATVGAFRFWQGGKVLEAKLKARDEARKAHAAAADAGRPTALLQREASVYSFSVYPVAAGELKRVETTIQMPFETEQGRSHLRLPVDSFLGQPAASSTVLVEIDTDEPLAAFGIEGEDPKVLRRAERSAAIVMSTARAVDLWWAEQAPPLLTRVAIVPMEEGKYGAEVCVALNDASAWHAPEREVHLLVDASFSMRRRSRALAQLIDRVRHRSRTPVVVHAVGDTVITFDERARAEEILRAITGGLAGHGSSWSGFEAEMAALGCGREGILCLVVTDPQLGGLQQAVASKTPVLFLADPDELAYYEARLGEHALVYQTETEPPARLLALADGFVRPVFGSVHLDQNGIALDPSGRQDAQVAEGGMLRLYFMTDSPAPIRIEGRIGGAAIERTLEPESLEPESHHGKSVRRGVYRRMLAAMLADWSRETSDELQQRIVDLSLREGIPTAFTALQVDDPELSLAAIKPGDRILTVHGGAASAPGRGTSSDPAGADRPLRASVGAPEGGSRSPLIERVMVRAKVVELDEGGENTTAFTDTFVEDLPVLGRSYQNVLTLVPGVSDPNNDGNPNVHGARERDFKATVDGVSNVDPLTGTFSSNISPDAIEEIEVVTTGASAEYGGALGGFGKIVTRQGTNVFDGSASVSLRSSRLDGNTASAGTGFERIIYRDVHPTLHLTGPVVKDKLFFALFHESIDQGRPITLLDGAGSRSGGGGSRVVVVTKGSRSLDKLTWQVSPRHKLAFLAQADPLRRGPLGIDSLTDPKSGFDYVQGGPTYQARWDAQISSVLSVQSLLGFSQTGISLIPNTRGVKNRCAWDELATTGRRLDPHGNPGGEPIDEDACFETSTSRRSGSYPSNYRDRRIRYTLKSDASWLLEHFLNVSHNLKAGVLAEKTKFTASDSERASSVFDEEPARASAEASGSSGVGVLSRQVSVPGLPDSATSAAEGSSYALYLEDQFRPHPNVSVRLGVRVEQEDLRADGFEPFDPARDAVRFEEDYRACLAGRPGGPDSCARQSFRRFHAYERFPTWASSVVGSILADPTVDVKRRAPQRLRISSTNRAPRLSVSWDPGTNGRTKLFATAGRYYGETFLAVPLYEQPPDTFLFTYVLSPGERCRPSANRIGMTCSIVPLVGDDAQASVFPATIRQVDHNLRTPYQDEYTLGFSREIFEEASISVTAIRRRYRDQFQERDVNHFAQDLGTVGTKGCQAAFPGGPLAPIDRHRDGVFDDCGGRLRVVPGADPLVPPRIIEVPDGLPDLSIHDPFFNQIDLIGNLDEEDYEAYEMELNKRLHRNWQLEASYVWSKAVGDAEDYNQGLGRDPTMVQAERGFLSYDQRHVVKVNVTTQLPLWNVRLGSVFRWASGLPYSITEERISRDRTRLFGSFPIAYSRIRTGFPTHRRNDQRNAGSWNLDVAARKDFAIGKANIEASLEVFNVLNEETLVVEAVRGSRLVATRSAVRQFQVGAKVTF